MWWQVTISSAKADHQYVLAPGRSFVSMQLRMQSKREDLMGIYERRIDFMEQRLMAVGEAHNGTAQKIPSFLPVKLDQIF